MDAEVLAVAALSPSYNALVVVALCLAALALAAFARVLRRVFAAFKAERTWASRKRRYDLTDRGFLPAEAVPKLPPYFEPWEVLAARLPELNATGLLYDFVKYLPLLDATKLLTLEDRVAALRRAYAILGCAVQSYAWRHGACWEIVGGKGPQRRSTIDQPRQGEPTEVPMQLALPWRAVCQALDLPAGAICACGTDLWNWQLAKPEARGEPLAPLARGSTALPRAADYVLTTSMTATATEAAFHSLATAMQQRAAPDLKQLLAAPDFVSAKDEASVLRLLRLLTALLRDFKSIFHDVWAAVDADVFYDVHRPLLSGSWERPLRLCGDADCPPILARAKGPSAGQSSIFMLIDVALGVRRAADAKLGVDAASASAHATFQSEMLAYMPAPHRELVAAFADATAKSGSLVAYVANKVDPRFRRLHSVFGGSQIDKCELSTALTKALEAYGDLRRFHLSVATRYLRRTSVGTGGSDFVPMLKDALRRTVDAAHESGDRTHACAPQTGNEKGD